MKTNNKTRANRWEREASRLLSVWVSGGRRKDLFWRTNSSGAKGTVTKEAGHCGDIVATDPAGVAFCKKFYVECKWKKDFDYAAITTIKAWISKEGLKARNFEKHLFMIIRGRAGHIFIMSNVKCRDIKRWNIPASLEEYLIFHGYAIYGVLKSGGSR